MKNVIRVTAVALVIVMLAATLASCGGLSGTYETGLLGQTVAYEFKGSKVTIKITLLGTVNSIEGKYKVSGDEITFEFEDDEAEKYEGTFTFEKGDDYIKIAGVKYNKQ